MIDLKAFAAGLEALNAISEKIADRGPIKVLPRPSSEVPNVAALKAELEATLVTLRVRRNYSAAKGHDLIGSAANFQYDLDAVGVVEEVKTVIAGRDRANPSSTTLVRVGFPAGEHLWFDPSDLEPFDASKSAVPLATAIGAAVDGVIDASATTATKTETAK